MVYDLVKERREMENDAISYDKIKWPIYKDLVFTRKNLITLPLFIWNVPKLVGLKEPIF